MKRAGRSLLNRTGDGREHVICVRSNEANGSNDQHEDYGQHDRIFGDVLTVVVFQEVRQTAHFGGFFLLMNLPEAGRYPKLGGKESVLPPGKSVNVGFSYVAAT